MIAHTTALENKNIPLSEQTLCARGTDACSVHIRSIRSIAVNIVLVSRGREKQIPRFARDDRAI
jgi:hypothetical protein